jgi:hypothetical protein
MRNKITSPRHAALTLGILSILAVQVGLAQSSPRWKSHDPTRPLPPVITPAEQQLPVAPPSDAVILFDGSDFSKWRDKEGEEHHWTLEDGVMAAGGKGHNLFTIQPFGDVQLHLEWSAPSPAQGSGQGRGNSGVFLMGRYELQILDSYENETYADGQAAAIYGQQPPLVNACRPPGEWQTYDIVFRRPRFTVSGELEKPARVTVVHNGVLVQDCVELVGGTMWLQPIAYQFHPDKLPISLQDHGNPVKFRNIWLRELRETALPGPGPREEKPEICLSSKELDAYVGCYRYRPDSKYPYEVFSNGRQLHCIFGEERAWLDLVANSKREFSMRWTAADVEFDFDEAGRATAMTLNVGGGSFTVTREK